MIQRPKVKIDTLDKNYESILNAIDKGDVFVAQDEIGYCVLINNKEKEGYKIITFNPHTEMIGRITLPKEELFNMCDKVLLKCNFSFFGIEDNKEYDIIESFDLIADALLAVKNGKSKHYRTRNLN